ncbi:hypothetical protein HNP72_001731 [Sphingobacterium soli]|nr:hypothetical protein [Sphingobacterium soli]
MGIENFTKNQLKKSILLACESFSFESNIIEYNRRVWTVFYSSNKNSVKFFVVGKFNFLRSL